MTSLFSKSESLISDFIFMDRKVRLYDHNQPKATIILIHGGCFQAGDQTWNQEQALDLQKRYRVYVPDFPQSNLNSSRYYLSELCKWVSYQHCTQKLIGIGTSSGGYHVLWLAGQRQLDYCLALCPVSDPYTRYKYLEASNHPRRTQMMTQQLTYFESLRKMEEASLDLQNVLILIPNKIVTVETDINVPPQTLSNFFKSQKYIRHHVILEGNHEICFQPIDPAYLEFTL